MNIKSPAQLVLPRGGTMRAEYGNNSLRVARPSRARRRRANLLSRLYLRFLDTGCHPRRKCLFVIRNSPTGSLAFARLTGARIIAGPGFGPRKARTPRISHATDRNTQSKRRRG